MRNFFRLAEGIMVMPLMHDIALHSELWDQDNTRTTFENSPHAQASDILIRFGAPDGDDLDTEFTDAALVLPKARELAISVMQIVGGVRLGRVVITKLEPGKKILPHADVRGMYAGYYTRYHLALQGLPGATFGCGGELVQMRSGELWWFNAAAEHAVANNSGDDRVHLLVDVRRDP